jgi:hypothetical protein
MRFNRLLDTETQMQSVASLRVLRSGQLHRHVESNLNANK